MKKFILLFATAFIIFAAQAQTQRTVQGIVRNDLKIAKSAAKAAETDKTFSMKNIKFWVYDGIEEADSLNCNQAALVISWHDGSKTNPDHLVWGYHWPKGEERCGLDMVEAVAKTDKRLLLLVQYTGSMGYTINGIGYEKRNSSQVQIAFDLEGAKKAGNTYPENAQKIADNAIVESQKTGLLIHPFGSDGTSRPAYDYDYWVKNSNEDFHWLAGWYNGYWSYFTRDAQTADWEYSSWGASSRKLTNNTWDAWSYNADMSTWEGTQPGSPLVAATYAPRNASKVMAEPTTETAPEAKVFYSNGSLRLDNLNGYTGYVYSIFGSAVSNFKINSDNETKSVNLNSGIYTFTGVKGSEKVSLKFSVDN